MALVINVWQGKPDLLAVLYEDGASKHYFLVNSNTSLLNASPLTRHHEISTERNEFYLSQLLMYLTQESWFNISL